MVLCGELHANVLLCLNLVCFDYRLEIRERPVLTLPEQLINTGNENRISWHNRIDEVSAYDEFLLFWHEAWFCVFVPFLNLQLLHIFVYAFRLIQLDIVRAALFVRTLFRNDSCERV